MAWHDYLPYVVFVVTFIASLLSGMTSGGGGYIITPFLIAIGLTPQQSVATIKLWALGMDSGALAAFRQSRTKHRKLLLYMVGASVIVGLVSAGAIKQVGNDNLQLAMGALNLAMIPILFIKHHTVKSRRRHQISQGLGFAIIVALMLTQAIFASGIGSLINVILVAFFGVSVLEGTFIKRRASFVSDLVILAGLAGSGLINISYGFIGMAAGLSGGYIGSKMALHEGEKFARYALMVFMLVSGVWLIATA